MQWEYSLLSARLGRALKLAKTTLDVFGARGYIDADRPELSFGPEKPVAEAAMLLYATIGLNLEPELEQDAENLAIAIAKFARAERVLLEIALNPGHSFKFALPHILLSKLGYEDHAFDRFVKDIATSPLANGVDRAASARLEKIWISGLLNGKVDAKSLRREARASVLVTPLDILGSRREDIYAFTHLLFYTTNFGFNSYPLSNSLYTLTAQAESLLARFLDAEDYDLSAELLLTWPFTGAKWTAAPTFAFCLLATLETEVGLLPCGNVDPARLMQFQGTEQFHYALGRSYHTALVMGLLCAALMRPSCARLAKIKIAAPNCTLLREFRALFHDTQGHWMAEFEKLDPSEQLPLLPFLCDLAIVQYARHKKYSAVADVTNLAERHRIPTSPLRSQALDHLKRLQNAISQIQSKREMKAAN